MINVPGSKNLRKIVVLNPKGGSGKSTIAANLAGYLSVSGQSVALMDCDPQGSSTHWLARRDAEAPFIHGIAACENKANVTRSWQLRVPPETRYLVVDTPASIPAHQLIDYTCGAHAILVPVMPSDIDTHAASRLMSNLLLAAKVSRRMGRLGVVANRVRTNTLGYKRLVRFLDRLSIAVVGTLSDSQNYLHATEQGLSIHEMQPSKVRADLDRWQPMLEWIESRTQAPLTARDFLRPDFTPGRSVSRINDSFR
ncbi:MAG: AAA family ATPase [Gammaproteobacteria bacterium]